MRYREMTADRDYAFLGSQTSFLANSPATVAQAILTRMKLFAREWFLDDREGLDKDLILGYGTQGTRDQAIQQRILGTEGVVRIAAYSSSVDRDRAFSVSATVDTIYGRTTIEAKF